MRFRLGDGSFRSRRLRFGGRARAWYVVGRLPCLMRRRGSLGKRVSAGNKAGCGDGNGEKQRAHNHFAIDVNGSRNVFLFGKVTWSCLSEVKTAFGQSTLVYE